MAIGREIRPRNLRSHIVETGQFACGPDYDYLDGLTLRVYPGPDSSTDVTVTSPVTGRTAVFTTTRAEGHVHVTSTLADGWTHQLA
ncbi:hypothetical protein ABT063_48580 [Streptomyces sp. NPDC002838]|uniref:hypothetical protein n=1 Tax=Streptomyces sp. NPDC002838 TaxID=3154436 RepID=UPI003332E874